MKVNKNLWLVGVGFVLIMGSCKKKSDSDPVPEDEITGPPTGKYKYIIAATPPGTGTETTNYILTADDVNGGSITTTGEGVEQDGYRYYVFHKNKVFSLLYGQGNPGAVTTYGLSQSGKLTPISNIVTESVHVFGKVNDEVLLIKVPRQGDVNANFYRIDANDPKILGNKSIDIVKLAGNGERAHFTGAFQVDNKVYVPYMSIKGVAGSVFHTSYTDSTWVAVFSYPDLNLERVIKDNRTSYIGYYFANSGLKQVENGDVYTFSTAVVEGTGIVPSTKPSAITRIKKGASEFDQSYFFNVQEKSGGHHLYKEQYFGNGKFLLSMYANAGKSSGPIKLAVVDVFNQTFSWIIGVPDVPTQISAYPYTSTDGSTISIAITTAADGPYVYNISVDGTATRGLRVITGSVTAIGKLEY